MTALMTTRGADLGALHEVFDAAAQALHLAEDGRYEESAAMLQVASLAADGAFPRGSPQAVALALILAAVRGGAPDVTPRPDPREVL